MYSHSLTFAMPKAPAASNACRAHAVSPFEVPPPPSTPLADADPELKNLPSLSRKADINDKCIRTILVMLAGDPPTNIQPYHDGHPVCMPRLNVGKSNQKDAARWFTMVRVTYALPLNKRLKNKHSARVMGKWWGVMSTTLCHLCPRTFCLTRSH